MNSEKFHINNEFSSKFFSKPILKSMKTYSKADYGSEGYRFESCGSHQAIYPSDHLLTIVQVVFFILFP